MEQTSEALSQPRMDAKPSDSSQPPDFIFLVRHGCYASSPQHMNGRNNAFSAIAVLLLELLLSFFKVCKHKGVEHLLLRGRVYLCFLIDV